MIRQSPFVSLSREGKRGLYLLGVLGAIKALTLVLMAEALAEGIARSVSGSDRWSEPLLLGAVAAFTRAAVGWGIDVSASRIAIGQKEAIRSELARRVLLRGGRDFDEGIGEITTLGTIGLDDLDDYFGQYLPALVSALTIPLVIGIRILFADLVSAIIILFTLPLIPIFMVLIGSYTQVRVTAAAESFARLSNHLVELARGLPVLIGLGRARDQVTTLREISSHYRVRTMETLKIAFLSALALELIAMLSVALVAVFIGVRLDHGTMPLQTGLLVLILVGDCYLPFREVGSAHHAAQDGIGALTRIRGLIDRPVSRLAPVTQDGDAELIGVRDLTVHYHQRTNPAVDQLSFSIPKGTIAALAGPSGSGKTTVISAIAGLLGAFEGGENGESVSVDGSVFGVERGQLAWVSQHPAFFAERVRDEVSNAALGNQQIDVDAVLRRVGIEALADRFIAELSPGETRLVAIARALARIDAGASLLLLDEPTAHLDRGSAQRVIRIIASLRGGVTVIMATHDGDAQQIADQVIALGQVGPIAAESQAGEHFDLKPGRRLFPGRTIDAQQAPSIRETFRVFWRLVDIDRSKVAYTILLGFLATASGIALTATSGWLIVRASQQPPILLLLVAIVGVRFFGVGRALFRYAERLILHDTTLRAVDRLRLRVWNAFVAQGPSVQRRLGGVGTVDGLIGDIDRLRDLTPRLIFPSLVGLLTAIAVTVGAGIILTDAIPVMIACSLLSIVVAPLVALWSDRHAASSELGLRTEVHRRFGALLESAADLRVNGMDSLVLAESERIDFAASNKARRGAFATGSAGAVVRLVCMLASIALLATAARAFEQGRISMEMVAVLTLTPLTLIEPFLAVSQAVRELPALRIVIGRFAWLESTSPIEKLPPISAIDEIREIELAQISAEWPGSPEPAVRDLFAMVKRGEWLTVTGPSGSGKSTLLSVIMGFVRPSAGVYRTNGVDTASMNPDSFRPRISWCPQEAHLFNSSLRANLLLARSREYAPDENELMGVLNRVGLGEMVDDMADGLDTRIGSQGQRLSGGQRQRVAVARALLTGADLVLIDEPTAHLDRTTARDLMDDLHHSLLDRAVVSVTHNPDDIAAGDLRIDLARESSSE